MGKTGLKAYADLVQFIGNEDENVGYHAIAASGTDTPREIIKALIGVLLGRDQRGGPRRQKHGESSAAPTFSMNS